MLPGVTEVDGPKVEASPLTVGEFDEPAEPPPVVPVPVEVFGRGPAQHLEQRPRTIDFTRYQSYHGLAADGWLRRNYSFARKETTKQARDAIRHDVKREEQ